MTTEEPESWFRYKTTPPGWFRTAVAEDTGADLGIGKGKWRVERGAADSSGAPIYHLFEDDREIGMTFYRNVARRWLGLEPDGKSSEIAAVDAARKTA